jgi:hypothetical protein
MSVAHDILTIAHALVRLNTPQATSHQPVANRVLYFITLILAHAEEFGGTVWGPMLKF